MTLYVYTVSIYIHIIIYIVYRYITCHSSHLLNVHICCFNKEFITYVVIWWEEKSNCIYFLLRSRLSKHTVLVWRIIECLTTIVTSFKKLYLTFICLFSKIHRYVRGSSSYFYTYIYVEGPFVESKQFLEQWPCLWNVFDLRHISCLFSLYTYFEIRSSVLCLYYG